MTREKKDGHPTFLLKDRDLPSLSSRVPTSTETGVPCGPPQISGNANSGGPTPFGFLRRVVSVSNPVGVVAPARSSAVLDTESSGPQGPWLAAAHSEAQAHVRKRTPIGTKIKDSRRTLVRTGRPGPVLGPNDARQGRVTQGDSLPGLHFNRITLT